MMANNVDKSITKLSLEEMEIDELEKTIEGYEYDLKAMQLDLEIGLKIKYERAISITRGNIRKVQMMLKEMRTLKDEMAKKRIREKKT